MKAILAVAVGGAIGSVLRYVAANAILQSTGGATGYGTFAVNVTGALALGFLARYFGPPSGESPTLFLALTVGLCGGYTTFSTFTLDMFTMAERGQVARASLYAVATVVFCYGALALGYVAARTLRPLP